MEKRRGSNEKEKRDRWKEKKIEEIKVCHHSPNELNLGPRNYVL